MSYVAAIDQGTSSSRVIIFDHNCNVVSSHQLEHKQIYPAAGFVEHDPLEIYANVKICAAEAMKLAGLECLEISSLGITNQRETTVVWNKYTGVPYHNAIVWNDSRTADICDKLARHGGKDRLRPKTGLPLNPYFSASKLKYILDNVSGVREAANKGEALFGTIDTWLVWNLTRGTVFSTDVSNASRTLLMNIYTLDWDDELLSIFNIPRTMLPTIQPSAHILGLVSNLDCWKGVPIGGVLGDQQAALFGQVCFTESEAKCTYGTCASIMMNTGTEVVSSENGLLTSVAYQLGRASKPQYCLEGSVAYSGSLIQWLRDNLGLLASAAESEQLALSVEDNGGVYIVPAFAGLFAPYWRSDARGNIVGLTAFNTKGHIVRAALEASAFQVKDVVDAMYADSGVKISVLRVDGGMTKNYLLMQFQADMLDIPLHLPEISETTSLGAAFAAGLAVGFWHSVDELKGIWKKKSSWSPHFDAKKRCFLMRQWHKAVARSMHWSDSEQLLEASGDDPDPHLITSIPQYRLQKPTAGRGVAEHVVGYSFAVVTGLALGVGFMLRFKETGASIIDRIFRGWH